MSKRPKIPPKVAMEVLYASEFRCCICRQPKGLQLHHIDGDNNNNDPNNLAPLCHDHHDQAHTKRALTKSLTPNDISFSKANWEIAVAKSRTEGTALHEPSGLLFRYWSYHDLRLFTLLEQIGIDPKQSTRYNELLTANIIDKHGLPTYQEGNSDKSITLYRNLHASNALILNAYLANLTDELIRVYKPKLINLVWPRKITRSLFDVGRLVFLSRQFYFRTTEHHGEYDTKEMRTSANNFNVTAQFDTRNIHSTSALSQFSGNGVVAGLFLVRSAAKDSANPRNTLIKLTPIALGTGFLSLSGHKPLVAIQREAEEEDEDWDSDISF